MTLAWNAMRSFSLADVRFSAQEFLPTRKKRSTVSSMMHIAAGQNPIMGSWQVYVF